MSFRLPELLKSESQKLDDLDMSSDISNDVDSSSTESNKSPNVKNTNVENTNVENTVNIEMVASETAEKAIYDAKYVRYSLNSTFLLQILFSFHPNFFF